MARFFLDPALWLVDPALAGDEAVHCARVMRLKSGDKIEVFDGCGRGAVAEIVSVHRDRVALRLGAVEEEGPPRVRLVLATAVLKGKAMEWMLQKAVELGVDEIQPLRTRHAVVKPGEDKPEKWRRIVLEACKQCGRKRMPAVGDLMDFPDVVRSAGGLRLLASLAGQPRPMRECLQQGPVEEGVTLLIGPEGDFSAEETAMALDAGWQPVSLGKTVLRSETAAIFGAAALRYAFE